MTEQTRSQSTEDERSDSQQESGQEPQQSTESSESAESQQSSESSNQGSSESQQSSESSNEESGEDSAGESGEKPAARRSENHAKPGAAGEDDQQTEQHQQQRSGDSTGSGTDAPKGRERRAPVNVGEVLWKIAGILATVVRVVGFLLAAVLVAFIVLTIVGVNPANGVAQVIAGIADSALLSFRDLFLIADPIFAVIVNAGLAAVFWVIVAEFGSRLIRFVAARLV